MAGQNVQQVYSPDNPDMWALSHVEPGQPPMSRPPRALDPQYQLPDLAQLPEMQARLVELQAQAHQNRDAAPVIHILREHIQQLQNQQAIRDMFGGQPSPSGVTVEQDAIRSALNPGLAGPR